MLTQTGHLTIAYAAPVAIRDAAAPNGLRVEEQISLTLKAAADEREYQYNLPISEKSVGLQQLETWANERTLVTVFASSLRALPFVHDTSKDEQGNPIKKYQRAGRKVKVGSGDLTIETDAFVIFSAYDVRAAGSVDTAKEAQAAAASFARAQAEFRKRSVQARIEKAKQRVREQEEAAAKAAAEAGGKGGAAAVTGSSAAGGGSARRTA